MAKKRLITGQPAYTDTSQYNFADSDTTPFDYNDSTGLPKNSDKFVKKDLYTNSKGDNVNNAIIDANLKFEGESFIRIERLRIINAGVSYPIRDIDIRGYLFSQEKYSIFKSSGNIQDYDDISLPSYSRFFKYTPSDIAEGNDVGNLTFVEGINIIENLGIDENLSAGDFTNKDDNFNGLDQAVDSNLRADRNVFDLEDSTTVTSIFEENTFNPIYFVFSLKGDADRAWGRDRRKRRYQAFEIDTRKFIKVNSDNTIEGITSVHELNDVGQSTTGDGGSGAAESSALIIDDFSITVNTIVGQVNTQEIADNYDEFISDVLPPKSFSPTDLETFLNQSPNRQLNNINISGTNMSTIFPDYFPKTTIGTADKDGFLNTQDNFIDLQSYYENDIIKSLQASAPATITFDLQCVNPQDGTMGTYAEGDYFYFVISWDDSQNILENFEKTQITSPSNLIELLELQNENLYIINKLEQSLDGTILYDKLPLKNTYNTPGIKTIKIIMFSYDEANKQIGRWKLIKSRFFLDIPRSEFPDFGELGGDDYNVIPWPNTTLVIGGVDDKSKYKTSIKNTLAGGKIGSTDIIDEKFLLQDLNNDELGKSISKMDLEQVRYFNKNYSINSLLRIENNPFTIYDTINNDGTPYWNGEENKFPEESSVGQIFINDNMDLDLVQSCQLELNTGNLNGKSIYDSSGNSNKGLLVGDYNIKKTQKGEPMRRDSFIKVPKKTSNKNGAL